MKPLLTLTFVLIQVCAAAQFGSMAPRFNPNAHEWGDKWYSTNRMEWGFGIATTTFFYEGSYEIPEGTDINTVRINRQINTRPGLGFWCGYAYPITKFGEKSALSITVNANYTVFKVENINLPINAAETLQGISTVQIGLPFSIDYKSGADAVYDKQYNYLYGFGIGMSPNYYSLGVITDRYPDRVEGFKLSPFIKGELGFRFGIAMKLRLTYTYRNKLASGESYVTDEDISGVYTTSPGKVNNRYAFKGKISQEPEFMASFIIFPFSFLWEKYK